MILIANTKSEPNYLQLNNFNFLRSNVGGSDGEHAGELHQDAAGFAYSHYFSFDSFEWAFLDFDGLAFAELVADFCEVDKILVEGRCYCYEVLHILIRNGERRVRGTVPVVVDRAGIAEAADVGVDAFAGPVDED